MPVQIGSTARRRKTHPDRKPAGAPGEESGATEGGTAAAVRVERLEIDWSMDAIMAEEL